MLQKRLLASVVGALATAAISSAAMALPTFTVNPLGLPPGTSAPLGTEHSFVADSLNGGSSELVVFSNPNDFTANGYIQFNAFSLNSNTVLPAITGINLDYVLYAKFQLAGTLISGPGGAAAGSTFNLTQADFQLFADPDTTTTFTAATSAGGAATVNDIGTADLEIGAGHLLAGTAGIDLLGGAFINANDTFSLLGIGGSFFTQPVPFYNMVFSAFNNTSQGVSGNGNPFLAIQASGIVDFNRLPEPDSVAVLGIVLGALGFTTRLGKKRRGKA